MLSIHIFFWLLTCCLFRDLCPVGLIEFVCSWNFCPSCINKRVLQRRFVKTPDLLSGSGAGCFAAVSHGRHVMLLFRFENFQLQPNSLKGSPKKVCQNTGSFVRQRRCLFRSCVAWVSCRASVQVRKLSVTTKQAVEIVRLFEKTGIPPKLD